MTTTSGTKEWADSNVNICYGCSNNCRYCYAKSMALRFKRIQTPQEWRFMSVNSKALHKSYKTRKGRIMFPTSHDITQQFLPEVKQVLEKMLEARNEVLITTKPSFACIRDIVDEFSRYKKQIQFRFTIGSQDDRFLAFWEPGAPDFDERLNSLKYAFEAGFKTSISMEPMLDRSPVKLIRVLSDFVSETIWLGTMNYLPKHIEGKDQYFYKIVKETKEIPYLVGLVGKLKKHPKIRWKDSISKRLNLLEILDKVNNLRYWIPGTQEILIHPSSLAPIVISDRREKRPEMDLMAIILHFDGEYELLFKHKKKTGKKIQRGNQQ